MLNVSDAWIIIAAIIAAAAIFIVGKSIHGASSSRTGRFGGGGRSSRPSPSRPTGGRRFGDNGDVVPYAALVIPGFSHASSSDGATTADTNTRHDGGSSSYDSGSGGSGGFDGGSGGCDGGSSCM